MKQTNYALVDFLDFDLSGDQKEYLWRAGKPLDARSNSDRSIIIDIPFQRQLQAVDLALDIDAEPVVHQLIIRYYGSNKLRATIDFGEPSSLESEMLQMTDLKPQKLKVVKDETVWRILNSNDEAVVVIDLSEPLIDYWSDLLPPPVERLSMSFYPDGKTRIKLSDDDQFFPARVESFGLAYIEKEGKIDRSTFSLHAKNDECFGGTGERFTKMDLSGKTFFLKNQDGQGVNNRRTYKNIPFYLSSENYGLFLHTSSYAKFSLADHSTRAAQLLVEDSSVDVFLFAGDNPEQILKQYRDITGFPSMPPLWSYGVWMSRMTYFSAEEVEGICDRLRTDKFPCDVIHLDTGWFETDWLCEWKFNKERFPDPKAFVHKLKEDGFRVSLWQMPYIAKEAEQHDEAIANNYVGPLQASRAQGGSNFSALDYAGTIDFTYPEAVEWYKDLLRKLLEMGVVCIKTDFGEEIHMEASYHGMSPEKLNNLYALLYQKAAYEVTEEMTGDGIIWARAGWAGCQRYPLHWGGDAACSWDGMAGSIKGGLHLGLSGFAYWSHDVPGFHGVPNFMNSVIPVDLYVRWTQFGVFSSHLRYHGTSKREPYEYPEIADIVRSWWNLRYALIPYILEVSEQALDTGYPVLRAMIFHHPNDKTCWHIDDQYYFGDQILVAPIMNSENKRDVYLPEGDWICFFSGKEYGGNQWIKGYDSSLKDMPVFVLKDSALSVYPEIVQCTDEMNMDKVVTISIDQNFKGIWNQLTL
ncbi:MAG: alpha-xylosidase [Cyclobacteriaceae bacterium]